MSKKKSIEEINPILKKLNIGYSLEKEIEKNLELQNTVGRKTKQEMNPELISNMKERTLSHSNRLKGYSKIQELKLIKIRLASSQSILEWAEKVLPNGKIFGEVLNANTLHYKTFKPHKGGLFCERIFGPLKDFECACGVKQKPSDSENYVQTLLETKKSRRNFCSNCDVEYTWSVIRRYQLGYIKLISPVTHLWYLKTNPSYLSLLLDIRKKELESIIYCMQITTLEYYWKPLYSIQVNINPSNLFSSYKNFLKLHPPRQDKKSINKKSEKNKEKVVKRKNLIIKRQGIYFTSSTTTRVDLLETNTLQKKIDHLEKSFKLSSTDLYPNTLAKVSKVTQFLKQKISRKIKKQSFLILSKKIRYDFYLENLNLFFIRTFKNIQTVNPLLKAEIKLFHEKNGYNIENNVKKGRISNSETAIFSLTLKNNLDSKSLFLKQAPHSYTRKRDKLENKTFRKPQHNINNNSKTLNSLIMTFKREDFFITLNQQNLTKQSFLKYFSKLIRLRNVKEPWTSIYKTRTNSIKFLSDFARLVLLSCTLPSAFASPCAFALRFCASKRQAKDKQKGEHLMNLNSKLNNRNQFGKFFKNSLMLYLLYIIQENNDAFLKNQLNHVKKHQTLAFVLNKLKLKEKDKAELLIKIKHTLKSKEKLSVEFLSKFLQTNFLLHRNEKNLLFFEIETVFKNSNNEFILFTNFFLNMFIKNLLNLIKLEKEEFKMQETEKIRITCLLNTNRPEKLFLLEQSKDFMEMSSLFQLNKKERVIFFKRLKFEKKVYQFANSTDLYPNNYNLYIKNIIQFIRNLKLFKYKKPLLETNLCNRIYTLSYFKGWETEREWRYFLYYNTNTIEISDKLQFYYQTRFESIHGISNSLNSSISIIGANLIQHLLFQYEGLELKKMAKQHQNILPKFNRYIRGQKQMAKTKLQFAQIQKLLQKRDQLIRRLKLLRKLYRKNSKTSSMILKTLPVLPPDLRPILKLQNQIAASDLNRFYQRIIYRNDRLKKFLKMNSILLNSEPGFEIKYGQRLLQEAVDNLIQNGKGNVKPETNSRGQPLKSLSEILKGKQGRFRQYLLGKRVDYSGRSVIVVGPTLKIYQCGLPFEMAMELFLPFLIKRIFQYQLARTVVGAKTILKTQKKTTWNLLEEIMYNHPILLNRAPTLHRLGIQAFQPKLIEGRAILLHPLVCGAFNADFDGDQMAVHVPITVEARTEAWKLMLSRNHLVSPATGEPMLLPSQDMVLGCYYLTTETSQYSRVHWGRPFINGTRFYFSNMNEILQLYLQEKIHLHTPVWLKWNSKIQFGSQFSQPLEIRLESNGDSLELKPKIQKRLNRKGQPLMVFIRTTAGRVIFNRLVETIIKN